MGTTTGHLLKIEIEIEIEIKPRTGVEEVA